MKVKGNALLLQQQKTCTKSDSVENASFSGWCANAIFLGTAGDVAFVSEAGEVQILPAMLAGMWHSVVPFKRVNSTGTTPTSIVVGLTFQG
jgi:hypothetical protein